MASYLGMLGMQPEANPQAADQELALKLAQMDNPFAQAGYGVIRGQQRMGSALGNAVRQGAGAALGVDTATQQEKLRRVKAQLQQALAGVDATEPEKFYPILIRVLQSNGLIAEAAQAASEFEDIKNKREDRSIKRADLARKEKADAAKEAVERLKIESRDQRSPLSKSISDLGALYARRETLPEDTPARAAVDRQIEVMEAALSRATKRQIKVVDLGATVQIIDVETNDVIREMPKSLTPGQQAKIDNPKAGYGANQPTSRPLPVPGTVDADGKAVFADKDGNQWVLNGSGGWKPADSGGRDTSDRGLPLSIGKMVAVNAGVTGKIEDIIAVASSDKMKKALGPKAYANRLVDTYDRLDVAGVRIRAPITDLGSTVLHQRSGAAVTVQEFDRLRGFLPQPTDSWAVVLNKLNSMKRGIEIETNALRSTFGGTGGNSVARPMGVATGAPSENTSAMGTDPGGLPPGVTVKQRGQ